MQRIESKWPTYCESTFTCTHKIIANITLTWTPIEALKSNAKSAMDWWVGGPRSRTWRTIILCRGPAAGSPRCSGSGVSENHSDFAIFACFKEIWHWSYFLWDKTIGRRPTQDNWSCSSPMTGKFPANWWSFIWWISNVMILISAHCLGGQILQVRTYKVAEDILDFLELALEAAKGPEETALGET